MEKRFQVLLFKYQNKLWNILKWAKILEYRILIVKTDAEAETPILWPPDAKSRLTGKDPDTGKDWRWEEKGMTEDEVVDDITNSADMSLSKL